MLSNSIPAILAIPVFTNAGCPWWWAHLWIRTWNPFSGFIQNSMPPAASNPDANRRKCSSTMVKHLANGRGEDSFETMTPTEGLRAPIDFYMAGFSHEKLKGWFGMLCVWSCLPSFLPWKLQACNFAQRPWIESWPVIPVGLRFEVTKVQSSKLNFLARLSLRSACILLNHPYGPHLEQRVWESFSRDVDAPI